MKIENTSEFWKAWDKKQFRIMGNYLKKYTCCPMYSTDLTTILVFIECMNFETIAKVANAARQLTKEINKLNRHRKVRLRTRISKGFLIINIENTKK